MQVIPFELNTRKQKWLLLPVYRPPNQNIYFFVEQISKLIDKFGRYENVLVLGDLYMEPNNKNLSPLLEEHNCTISSKDQHVSRLTRDGALTYC